MADLLEWLGSPSDSSASAVLEALEERAVDVIQAETARYFGPVTAHTERLVGDGTDVLRLRERPSSLTSVEERARPGDDWEAIGEEGDDGWEIRLPPPDHAGAQLLRKRGYRWRAGYEYRVTYDFGYAEGEEPLEIQQAVIDLVALKFNERGREGLRSETVGDHSYSVMATAVGRRDIYQVPGLAETVRRWRGLVVA